LCRREADDRAANREAFVRLAQNRAEAIWNSPFGISFEDSRRFFGDLLHQPGNLLNQAPGMIALLSFALLCLLAIVLAWIDIRHGIIPDWLNLAIAGLGLARAWLVGGPWVGLDAACEGAAIGLIFLLLRRLYFAWRKIQGLGLGDVKFLAG